MVLKSPSATMSMFFSIARWQGGDFQDHGSEGVQTMVPDHGFARGGTMQVQAIMPPLMARINTSWHGHRCSSLTPEAKNSFILCKFVECCKWGCNKRGFKGCLASLHGNRRKWAFLPFYAFLALFGRVRRAPGKSRKWTKTAFSSDILRFA